MEETTHGKQSVYPTQKRFGYLVSTGRSLLWGVEMKPTYCVQNDGKCEICSLVNYGRDCRNVPITRNRPKAKTEKKS